MAARDELEAIRMIVREETRFLRHYPGKVVNVQDPKRMRRILVTIPELGWEPESKGAWCSSRQLHAMDMPRVGEWVEVYFVGGDRTRPAYLAHAYEMADQAPPPDYSDDARKHVIYGWDGSPVAIIHNEAGHTLTLKTGDAAAWKPNTLVTDPFTGLPHSTIIRLKGA